MLTTPLPDRNRGAFFRHVVSLELARRLKDAGFQQDTEFCWAEAECDGDPLTECWPTRLLPRERLLLCAAPLLSEVMEAPPQMCVQCLSSRHGWLAWEAVPANMKLGDADTGPDAAALLWLALKETALG